MPIFEKSKAKTSARNQIGINGIREDILLLPGGQYRLILEVSSLNFELRSEDEQDALIDTYEAFLNALPCRLQILVRIRELDIDNYLADLRARMSDEEEAIYQEQLTDYCEFVQDLVVNNRILSRHFYVVIPASVHGSDAFETAKEQLHLNSDLVSRGFQRLGIQTRQLESLEVLDLFHSFYNPGQAKRQPISERVVELLNSAYVQGIKS